MSSEADPNADPGQPAVYHIRIRGQLGAQWAGWFDGMTLTLEEDGATLLTGPVVDQAALFGLLRKVRDLGLPLLSVIRLEPAQGEVSDGRGKSIQNALGEDVVGLVDSLKT